MSETAKQTPIELAIDIEASPETVWGILTSPERFSMWMDAQVTFDLRTGSPFRAEFPAFHTVIAGEIQTLDAEARHLGLTWGVESGPQAEGFPAGSSLLELRVHPADDGCRVELRHGGLPSEQAVREMDSGWRFHLGRMALFANRSDLAAGLRRTLPGWFAAWNETDAETRVATLRACCAPEVEFRDDWAAAHGIETLNLHISNTIKFLPGYKLESTGDVRICRGEALVGWRSVGPGGVPMEGMNHVRAAPDGTILRVTGFPAAQDRELQPLSTVEAET